MKQEFENTRQKLLIELSRVQAALKGTFCLYNQAAGQFGTPGNPAVSENQPFTGQELSATDDTLQNQQMKDYSIFE